MANGVNHARAAAVPAGVERVRKALREQGSGVLTQIDVRQTLHAKPNTDVAGAFGAGRTAGCREPFE